MGYKIFQETVLKVRFTAAYISKIIGFAIIMQVFVFSFFFTQTLKQEGFDARIYAKSFLHKELKNDYIKQENILIENYQLPLIYSSAVWFLPFLIFAIFRKKENNKMNSQHRGTRLIKAKELEKSLKFYSNRYLKIGGYNRKLHFLNEEDDINLKKNKIEEIEYRKTAIEIPIKFEYYHFCIIGKSGTGKTSLINPLVSQIRARGDRMIIHDYKQDFFNNFYDSNMDLVFNPANPDLCLRWSIFNDIHTRADIISVASSLIPVPTGSEDKYWSNSARDILIACLIYLIDAKKTTNIAIYELVNSSIEQIQEQLLSCPDTLKYCHVFDKSNAKTIHSVMSVFRSYIRCFDFLKDIDGKFSVKKWSKSGVETIFVQNDESVKDANAPSLTLFIDLISKSLLMQEDRQERTIMMLDELGRLNRMSSVVDLLTNGRSKGVSVYIAAQELAQIDEKYGKNGRKTIINNCSNQIFFGHGEAVSAREIAEQIGEAETETEDESIHHRTEGDDMDGLNIRKHKQVKLVVLPSEVLALKERECYVKIANQNWTKTKVYIQKKELKSE